MDKTFYRMSLRVLILVTGSMGLFACSSSDEPEAPAKPLDPTNTVKTQFAISVPRSASGGSRMSEANTQNTSDFRFLGMQDIILIPTAKQVSGVETDVISTIIALPDLGSTDLTNTDSHRLYNDVSIPVGTKSFLFYGQATRGSKSKTQIGSLKTTLSTAITKAPDITFSLEKILSSDQETDFSNVEKTFQDYLNAVIQSKALVNGTQTSWSSLEIDALDPSDKILLARRADDLKAMKAGSATAIKNVMNALYVAVNRIADDDASVYNALAKEIQRNITSTMFTWTDGKLEWAEGIAEQTKTFPESFGVPQGSVSLSYNTDAAPNSFEYTTNPAIGPSVTTGTAENLNVAYVTYPAALYYWVNTFARISNDKSFETAYTPTDWLNAEKWAGWTATSADETASVQADTRKIALIDNINYAVASLVSTIKCADQAILMDNATAYTDAETGIKITTSTQVPVPTDGFPVKGILIGGQPNQVAWNFENTNNHNSTIYDTAVSTMAAKRNVASDENYTLVLDNNALLQESVKVAIELENNSGVKFYGKDGIVYPGSRFYMIASLDPADGTKPEGDDTINRVFIKDYKTTANFTIKSLENAYVTVPDLRATQLQLGLSVDLEWQQGLTFNADL